MALGSLPVTGKLSVMRWRIKEKLTNSLQIHECQCLNFYSHMKGAYIQRLNLLYETNETRKLHIIVKKDRRLAMWEILCSDLTLPSLAISFHSADLYRLPVPFTDLASSLSHGSSISLSINCIVQHTRRPWLGCWIYEADQQHPKWAAELFFSKKKFSCHLLFVATCCWSRYALSFFESSFWEFFLLFAHIVFWQAVLHKMAETRRWVRSYGSHGVDKGQNNYTRPKVIHFVISL